MVLIREFISCRAAKLYALFQDVYSTSDGMSEALKDKYPDLPAFEKDIADLHRLPGSIALVAESDDRLAGYLTVRPRRQTRLRHTADLNMGVALAARGQGVGGTILREAIERARRMPELEIVYLMVRSDNTPAINLYKKIGFEPLAVLSRDSKVDTSYFDGILMRRFVDK